MHHPIPSKNTFDENVFESFLQELLRVKRKYEVKKKDAFNVFWMLDLAYKEHAHSAFIGELLNPRGLHGKKGAFLELFCKQMKIHYSPDTYKLLEYSFEKGRLDVYLPCNDNPSYEIIIENKINASDQNNQLNWYRDCFPDANLFYLTLDGRKASKKSTGGKDDFYKNISYRKDILEWLKSCKEVCIEDDDSDILKMIEQYEDVVRMLTFEVMSDAEKIDVLNVLQNSMIPLNCLQKNDSEIEREFEKYIVASFEHVAEFVGAEMKKCSIEDDGSLKINDLYRTCSGVSFKFSEWDECVARLEFQKDKYQDIFYGIRYIGKENQKRKNFFKHLEKMFKDYFEQKNETGLKTKKFLVGAYWLRYKNWTLDSYLRVLDGSFEKDLLRLLENIKWYMKAYLPKKGKEAS